MALSLEDMILLGRNFKTDRINPAAFNKLQETLFTSNIKRSLSAFNDVAQVGILARAMRTSDDKSARKAAEKIESTLRETFIGN